jgi:hypothetical protein
MRQGYLSVETHPDHPDQVRIVPSERAPVPPDATAPDLHAARVRCVVRFEDLDVATMHAHTALRRRVVDIDDHRYRVDPVTAVAAIDAIGLRHQRIHLDPAVANDPALADSVEHLRARRRRRDAIWNGVGLTALIWLLVQAILGF